jgi:hypothetical protein
MSENTPKNQGFYMPAEWETNWVKSEPGKGWFPYIRCYAPAKE